VFAPRTSVMQPPVFCHPTCFGSRLLLQPSGGNMHLNPCEEGRIALDKERRYDEIGAEHQLESITEKRD